MYIEVLDDPYEITRILTNEKIFELTYGQNTKLEDFKLDTTWTYLGIIENDLIGLGIVKEWNKIVLDSHFVMLPRYWGTNKSIEAVNLIKKYLKENTTYLKLFVGIPAECNYIHQWLSKVNFNTCGKITDGIIYNNNKQDLVLYESNIEVK